MVEIKIDGYRSLKLENLVLDFNGTIAVDGRLGKGVKRRVKALAKMMKIYVLTADTFGKSPEELARINCELHILKGGRIDLQKRTFVKRLGARKTVCIGNGKNDRKMLEISKLSILVMGKEGFSIETMGNADIGVTNIVDGLDLLLKPKRLIATLRLAGG